ncbi:MAG: hypothetical protein KDE68_10435 [Rhodocyclaceae bacterium]|nr:hypothetical protein [Rhodocyclaceae bacterium]
MSAPDLVILTDPRYLRLDPSNPYQQQIASEEGLIADALAARGLRVARWAWSDPATQWATVAGALFRSTWDYVDHFAAFMDWVARTEPLTRLFNPATLIRWNSDKRYLDDMTAAGIAVIPTHFVEPGATTTLGAVMDTHGWDAAVYKPVVSAGARLTFRAERADAAVHEARFADCVAAEAMMVQRFEPAIVEHGELSLMVIDGRFTHAVRKRARAGDFRVQDDHGGTVHPHAATADERDFARAVVAACPCPPLYARVDVVRRADGSLHLMELELIEPELFFRHQPEAAQALADALVRQI